MDYFNFSDFKQYYPLSTSHTAFNRFFDPFFKFKLPNQILNLIFHYTGFRSLFKYDDVDKPFYSKYSQAFPITNEPIREILQQINPNGKSVLTVIGGDAPLFFNAFEAKKIDTFDISIFAQISYTIKLAMIKAGIPYQQYQDYVQKLPKQCHDLQHAPYYKEIKPYLPKDTINILKQTTNYPIIRCNPNDTLSTLNETEYNKIRPNLDTNFILSDLWDLTISDTYDIIYLSNIFHGNSKFLYQHIKTPSSTEHQETNDLREKIIENCTPIISIITEKLAPHLSPDGVIVLDSTPITIHNDKKTNKPMTIYAQYGTIYFKEALEKHHLYTKMLHTPNKRPALCQIVTKTH